MKSLLFIIAFACSLYAQGKVLVISPINKDFQESINALKSNLSDLEVKILEVKDESTPREIVAVQTQFPPDMIVLMDNKAMRLYKQYLKEIKPAKSIPVLAMMALQIESSLSDIPNSLGISYEIPAVTTISRLRTIMDQPIKKVGVIYRNSMEPFFIDNKKFCKVENIDLVGKKMKDDDIDASTLKDQLNDLVYKDKIDAIWLINDNKFLTAKLIKEVWIPFIKSNEKLAIVGIELLVQTKLNLGAFAVLPDHSGLGAQAANIVYEVMDNGWVIESKRIDKPLSVIQILNLSIAKKFGKPKADAAKSVDKIIE